jgi:hypothetical protein
VSHLIAFKCKICGGNLEIEQGKRVSTCSSCGSTHSLPNLENDKVRNLFERANQLRLNHEFDKAMGVYETIVTENPTDPETYWSLVLCRYGVEYVEDPKIKKRVMTTHRTLPQSVLRDGDYQQAIKLASSETKRLYQEEANQIDSIQKGILTISNQEDPYDIFICYKETDQQGRRTIDSVLGQKLYEELIEEGFKVFFAKITLEDKLGQEYEPYIYSALTTSKVMLVLGTQAQYFEAPWVRNEWSRFLTMMKAEKKKTLIPLYRDMDAYGLPEEFRIFQSQDLNKVGATQDLIRGLKKLIPLEKQNVSIPQKETSSPKDRNVSTKIKRALIALEDADFTAATNFAEEALDIDPESAEAYLVKWLSELEVKSIDDLFDIKDASEIQDYQNNPQEYIEYLEGLIDEDNAYYQKVKKFGKKTILPLIEASIQKNKLKILSGVIENIETALIRGGSSPEDFQVALNSIEPKLSFIHDHPKGQALLKKVTEAKENLLVEFALLKARGLYEANPEDLDGALKPLKNYLAHQQVQKLIEELTSKYRQYVKEKESIALKQKQEIYKEITLLIKKETIKGYLLAISQGKEIQPYEDVESLMNFAKDKLKVLLTIRKKKIIKVSIISTIVTSILAITSYILYVTLPLNEVMLNNITYQKHGNAYHVVRSAIDGQSNVKLPNGVRGLPVTSINERAFYQSQIENLELGYFVETIKTEAFLESNIVSIDLKPRLTKIEEKAFAFTNLTSLMLPSSIQEIGLHILQGSIELKNLSIPFIGSGPTTPQTMNYLFQQPNNLQFETIDVYNQTALISSTFSGYDINQLYLGKATQSIEQGSLALIENLEKLSLPFVGQSRLNLDDSFLGYIFGADSLSNQSTKIPQSLTTLTIHDDEQIEPFALSQLTSLEALYLIEGTKRLSSYAITQNPNLSSIFLSNQVDYVGPFGIYQVGSPTIYIEHDNIPSLWSSRWNEDSLNVSMGVMIDEI